MKHCLTRRSPPCVRFRVLLPKNRGTNHVSIIPHNTFPTLHPACTPTIPNKIRPPNSSPHPVRQGLALKADPNAVPRDRRLVAPGGRHDAHPKPDYTPAPKPLHVFAYFSSKTGAQTKFPPYPTTHSRPCTLRAPPQFRTKYAHQTPHPSTAFPPLFLSLSFARLRDLRVFARAFRCAFAFPLPCLSFARFSNASHSPPSRPHIDSHPQTRYKSLTKTRTNSNQIFAA